MKSTDDLIRELKEFERKKDAFFREKSGALDNKKNEKPIVTGYTVHVFSNSNLKPIRIPEPLRSKVELARLDL